LWVPIEIGKQAFPIILAALKTGKHRVNSGGTVLDDTRVQLFERTRKYQVVSVHHECIRRASQLETDVPGIG